MPSFGDSSFFYYSQSEGDAGNKRKAHQLLNGIVQDDDGDGDRVEETRKNTFGLNEGLAAGPVTLFGTAGSKSGIEIEKASRHKARRLLDCLYDDDDVGDEGDDDSTPKTTFDLRDSLTVGSTAVFRTAGSKSQIHVDEGNMRNAHRLLNDIVGVVDDDIGDENDGNRAEESPKNMLHLNGSVAGMMAVFETAGSKSQIHVDEGNMRNAHRLLNDIVGVVDDDNGDESDGNRTEESPKKMLHLNGSVASMIAVSKTARSKSQIHVDEGNMRKARRLLNDVVAVDSHDDRVDDDEVVDEIDGDRAKETPVDAFEVNVSLAAGLIAVFRTAGSKSQVQVDESNMRKAHLLLDDIVADNEDDSDVCDEGAGDIMEETSKTKFDRNGSSAVGSMAVFCTAGLKSQINVDECSMRKACRLLNEIVDDDDGDEGVEDRMGETPKARFSVEGSSAVCSTAVFHTAGSKSQIQVDEGNMRQARRLLNEIVDVEDEDVGYDRDGGRMEEAPKNKLDLNDSSTVGSIAFFHTAGSKSQIQVEEGNIRKARQLLDGIDNDEDNDAGDREEVTRKDMYELRAAGSLSRCHNIESHSQNQVDEGNNRNAHRFLSDINTHIQSIVSGVSPHSPAIDARVERAKKFPQGESSSNAVIGTCTAKRCVGVHEVTPIHSSTYSSDMQKGQIIELSHTLNRSENFNEPQKSLSTTLEEAYRRGALCSSVKKWVQHGVDDVTIQVDSQNAIDVHFDAMTGRPVFSSGYSSKYFGSTADIKQSLSKRGCDIKAMSNLWILNHKRWIVWNLACYERSFCSFVGGRYLSYERLVRRLERRYRKEICAGYRPITRMILNKDAAASLPMVLIVTRYNTQPVGESKLDDQSSHVKLRLTDGWYDIDAELDSPLSQFVKAGIIRVGTKLLVSNAKLRGAGDGIDPLDTPYQCDSQNFSRPYLSLTANSTRLAKWNCKLGLIRKIQECDEKFSVTKRVSDIIAGGGCIPRLHLMILRCYPMMYLEKGPNAAITPLSEAEEHERVAEIERRKLQTIEKVYEQVRCEVEKTSPKFWKRKYCNFPCDGNSSDHERQAITDLVSQQQVQLERRVHEAVEAELQLNDSLCRKSTPFIRVKVHTATACEETSSETAILTVWDPSEDQVSLLKEGSVIEVMDVSVRPAPFDGFLQLSINGRAAMKCCETCDPERNPAIHIGSRVTLDVFKVHNLSHRSFNSATSNSSGGRPPSTSFDVRGILVGDVITSRSETTGFELYVTDESLLWLRVHFEKPPNMLMKQSNLSGSGERRTEPPSTVVIFKDLYLRPFDTITNCAVAKYSALSSISRVSGSHEFQLEKQMKGFREILHRMSCSMHAKLPWYESDACFSRIGYIIGVKSGGGETLLVDVDCGTTTHQWIVPSNILEAIRQSVDEGTFPPTSFLESRESRLLEIRTLDFLFRIRHVLWKFDVISTPKNASTTCAFIVQRITIVDQRCLSMMYPTHWKA